MSPVDLSFVLVCAAAVGVLLIALRRSRSIALTIVVATTVGVIVMAVGVAAASRNMFLSEHDLDALTPLLLVGAVAGAGVGLAAALPLVRSLRRLRLAAERIGRGEHPDALDLRRHDEMGAVSDAFDVMVGRLRTMEHHRGVMLSSIGHDLRTPLAAIRACVEALRDGMTESPERTLLSIERSAAALGYLIDDLFLYARLTAGGIDIRSDTVDAAAIVEEAVEMMRPVAAARNVELRSDTLGPAPLVGDGRHLGRLLRNLLDNSVQHVGTTGAGQVVASVRTHGDSVVIAVADNGPGFPPDFAPIAFEPFTRADPSRNRSTGTAGLGLAIAREIVGHHQGKIRIGAGPGGRVEIVLPITT